MHAVLATRFRRTYLSDISSVLFERFTLRLMYVNDRSSALRLNG